MKEWDCVGHMASRLSDTFMALLKERNVASALEFLGVSKASQKVARESRFAIRGVNGNGHSASTWLRDMNGWLTKFERSA